MQRGSKQERRAFKLRTAPDWERLPPPSRHNPNAKREEKREIVGKEERGIVEEEEEKGLAGEERGR